MKKLLEDAPQFDFIIGSVHLLSRKYGGADLYDYMPATAAEAQEPWGLSGGSPGSGQSWGALRFWAI